METQGDFVQSLASEVRAASFTKIDDLVAFVNWLDEELSFLVRTLSVSQFCCQSGLKMVFITNLFNRVFDRSMNELS